MSQVRKTTFITLAFMFSAGLLTGCGISGPLYAPGTGDDMGKKPQSTVVTPASESADAETNETPTGDAE